MQVLYLYFYLIYMYFTCIFQAYTVNGNIVDRNKGEPYYRWTVKKMEQMGFFRNLEHFYGPPILRLGSWTWRFFLRVPSRRSREGTKEIVRLKLQD